jgi:quinohemoprotein ethanol dehydrogenase
VLHDGDMVAGGMPDYPELSDDEIEGLRHYFREGARKAMAQQ